MAKLGKINTLPILTEVDFGYYLDGGELGELLLPTRYVPEDMAERSEIEVFVSLDSEDRPIATTETPFCTVGECANLKVTTQSDYGAFLDWGLTKDVLAPFKEQRIPMQEGKHYVVHLFIDVTGRIAASSKLDHYLSEKNNGEFQLHEQVNLLIASRSDFGYKAVINGTHLGLIHNSDVLQPIEVGTHMQGYIKTIREEDDKLDLRLQALGREATDSLCDEILAYLRDNGGSSNLTDKSAPDAIYAAFKVSKSNYKKALGRLYKEKCITIDKDAGAIALKS